MIIRPPVIIVALSMLLPLMPECLTQVKGENPRARLAQNYENAGKYEEAAAIYEELHAADPANIVFFEGRRRTYLQLKRYTDAAQLLRERITMYPRDVNLRAQLGSVLYKAGNETAAKAEWDGAIALDPSSAAAYRAVAAILTENRLLEQTADLYQRARTATGNPDLFTMELAQLLAVSMDYTGATREYLRYLRGNPNQLSFIEGKMAGITLHKEGRDAAIAVTRGSLSDDQPQVYELLAWLLLEGKEYDEAYDVVRHIDELTKAKGGRIYAFAERAFKEREFDAAARAYRETMESESSGARIPAARYGYASCLKEMSILEDSIDGTSVSEAMPRYAGAVAAFNEIIRDYPRTEYAARAQYQIGLLQIERFFDIEGALRSFDAVEKELPLQHSIRNEVSLRIGQTLVMAQDTVAASQRFRSVIAALNATPDQQDEATFRLAELEFFRGQFAEATKRLEGLTVNLQADYANDALRLLTFLQENSTSAPGALREFARASSMIRQRRIPEAIPVLQKVANEYPKAPLADDALMTLAGLLSDTGQAEEAIATYEHLLKDHASSSIALDVAQFRIGEVYQFRLKDPPKAIAAYEQLLANYPRSIHLTEARKRIRMLRGESL
jgi:tetratricopeptide (TPR) repeat protein